MYSIYTSVGVYKVSSPNLNSSRTLEGFAKRLPGSPSIPDKFLSLR